MGYLSPRTEIIKVNLNNKSFEMIFQEKAAKELLENNNLRESAILESDIFLIVPDKYKGFKKVKNEKLI